MQSYCIDSWGGWGGGGGGEWYGQYRSDHSVSDAPDTCRAAAHLGPAFRQGI